MILLFFFYGFDISNMTLLLFVERNMFLFLVSCFLFLLANISNQLLSFSRNKIKFILLNLLANEFRDSE